MPVVRRDNSGPPSGDVPGAVEAMFEQLLAYLRDEISGAAERAAVEAMLRDDPACKAHWESVQLLHLEEAAARQDGKDLEAFDVTGATPFCLAAAENGEKFFAPLLGGKKRVGSWSRKEWLHHAWDCVYCRRMWRKAQALAETERLAEKVPALRGKLLLRDWRLGHLYEPALAEVTAQLLLEVERVRAVKISEEGPTLCFRKAPKQFSTRMAPYARRLLKRVLHTDEPLSLFLQYLRKDEVLQKLGNAKHVRAELGRVLADFCRETGLANPDQVRAAVTAEVIRDTFASSRPESA